MAYADTSVIHGMAASAAPFGYFRNVTEVSPLINTAVQVERLANEEFRTNIASSYLPAAPSSVLEVSERIAIATFNPWLINALRIISRELASDAAMRQSAETLASDLAAIPFEIRPQLHIDEAGVVGFATVRDGLYLAVNLDSPQSLTWYSVEHGTETYSESNTFDGTLIPSEIAGLISDFGRPRYRAQVP